MGKKTCFPVTEFSLPLDREAFTRALKMGLGRARMHIEQYGANGLEDLIIQACCREQAYDPQLEGGRSDWMADIVEAASMEDRVLPEVLSSLAKREGVKEVSRARHDTSLLVELACEFASRGHEEARDAAYEAARRNPNIFSYVAYSIVWLDGEQGLRRAAEVGGEFVQRGQAFDAYDFLLWPYDDDHTKGDARRILDKAAATNTKIAMLLTAMDAQAEASEQRSTARDERSKRVLSLSAEAFIRAVQQDDPDLRPILCRAWGRHATEEQLTPVIESMFKEKNPKRCYRLLRTLLDRETISFDARYFDLLESESPDVRRLAYGVLQQCRHPELRARAIKSLEQGSIYQGEIGLFVSNYEPGDRQLIEQALSRVPLDKDLYFLGHDLLDVFSRNERSESADIMAYLYEHVPGAMSRSLAAERLVSIGQLSEWIREEAQKDACDCVRDSITKNAGDNA